MVLPFTILPLAVAVRKRIIFMNNNTCWHQENIVYNCIKKQELKDGVTRREENYTGKIRMYLIDCPVDSFNGNIAERTLNLSSESC